jgi:hypothetical protein
VFTYKIKKNKTKQNKTNKQTNKTKQTNIGTLFSLVEETEE